MSAPDRVGRQRRRPAEVAAALLARARGGAWREPAAAALLLAALLAVAYGNVVFRGGSVAYSDNFNPMDDRPLNANFGPDMVPRDVWLSQNLSIMANFHDPAATLWQWEPGGQFLRRALQEGELPFWDPYVGGGAPAMAQLTQTFFFPPYVAMVVAGDTSGLKNLYFLLVLLTAAWCTFLLLRRHGIGPLGALGGAVATLFCGGLNQNVGSFIGQAAACLPVALLLTSWFLERPTRRRQVALALGYATIALCTFPPLILAAFAVAAAYAAVLIAGHQQWRQRALRYAIAAALGGGLVAFAYLPALRISSGLPQVQRTYLGAGLEVVRWPALSQLLSPALMGGGKIEAEPPMPDIGPISVPYLGVVALALAGLAWPSSARARALFATAAVGSLLIACKLVGVVPVQWLGRLPVLDHIHFAQYYGIPLVLLLAILAGMGIDRLQQGRVGGLRLAVVFGGLGAAVLAMPAVALLRGTFGRGAAGHWLLRWYVLVACLVAAALLAALVARLGPRGRRLAIAGLLALMAAEGVLNNAYPRQHRWDPWHHPPQYVRELAARRDQGRVYASAVFPPNAASAFEVRDLGSLMTFNSNRTFELYRRYAAPGAYLFMREPGELPPDGVLDAANVALVALHTGRSDLVGEATARGYWRFFEDGRAVLFTRATEPRFFFTSDYRLAAGDAALAALAPRRPPRQLLLETPPGSPPVPNQPGDPAVRVRSLGRNGVTLEVTAPRPGLVYASESHFPGWHARVDGKPAPLLLANYAFQAVAVPAGRSVVELAYWPPGLAAGGAVSGAALLLVLGLAFWRRDAEAAPLLPRPATARQQLALRRLVVAAAVVLVAGAVVAVVPRALSEVRRRQWIGGGRVDPLVVQPNEFYVADWARIQLPPAVHAGERVTVLVTVRNPTPYEWPHRGPTGSALDPGAGAVRLAHRWWNADGSFLVADYVGRTDLQSPVAPGETITVPVVVTAPGAAGRYQLQLDLVHETISWFEPKMGRRKLVEVEVGPR